MQGEVPRVVQSNQQNKKPFKGLLDSGQTDCTAETQSNSNKTIKEILLWRLRAAPPNHWCPSDERTQIAKKVLFAYADAGCEFMCFSNVHGCVIQ